MHALKKMMICISHQGLCQLALPEHSLHPSLRLSEQIPPFGPALSALPFPFLQALCLQSSSFQHSALHIPAPRSPSCPSIFPLCLSSRPSSLPLPSLECMLWHHLRGHLPVLAISERLCQADLHVTAAKEEKHYPSGGYCACESLQCPSFLHCLNSIFPPSVLGKFQTSNHVPIPPTIPSAPLHQHEMALLICCYYAD